MNHKPTDNSSSRVPAVSIIVPVYKAEAYLHRCVDSLLAQTMPDFEVLLVDDGSPDRSGALCDEYAAKDPRVRVFHKPNEGVSIARQYGLDHAQGEYVIHADPDDWVEPDMLEHMLGEIRKTGADMLICDFWCHGPGSGDPVYDSQRPLSLEPNRLLKGLIRQQLHGSTCNKLVRLSFIRSHQVAFDPQTSFWEDIYFICDLLRFAPRVAYLPKAYYHYDCQSNSNSIVRTRTIENIYSMKCFVDHFSEVLDPRIFREDMLYRQAVVKAWAIRLGIGEAKHWYPGLDRFMASWRNKLLSPLFVLQLSLRFKPRRYLGRIISLIRRPERY